ncbi:KamA family radical SAM protein, partial [Pseudomonas sp. SIMBA_064]
LDALTAEYLQRARAAGITLLNQAVLLKGVSDTLDAQVQLSQRLFACGVLPYYLHVLDKVAGAAHFDSSEQAAIELYWSLLA